MMLRSPHALAWAAALLLCVPAASGSARASEPPITLGEVTVSDASSADLLRSFRRTVERELARIGLDHSERAERFVLSATLVALERRPVSGKLEISCRVSAALRREGGELHALLNGRARAEAPPAHARGAEQGVMEAAVGSALRRVPEAMR